MQGASDGAIWDHAFAESFIIVTKDEDFAQRKVLAAEGPTVIWIRLPNTRGGVICSPGLKPSCLTSSRRSNAANLWSKSREPRPGTLRIRLDVWSTDDHKNHMTFYSVASAKAHLSELIDRAAKGEPVVITRHGRPIVELKPFGATQGRPMTSQDVERLRTRRTILRVPDDDPVSLVERMRDEDNERLLRR
jgi:prevent-host-death family protein